MLFQKNYISPTFSEWVGLGSRSKSDLEKKFVNYLAHINGKRQILAFTFYCKQRENMINQYFFF